MKVLGRGNFTKNPHPESDNNTPKYLQEIDETFNFLKLPSRHEALNENEDILRQYHFPLIREGFIYGRLVVTKEKESFIQILHLFGSGEVIADMCCKEYQLGKSPLEVDCEALLSSFLGDTKKAYDVSNQLSPERSGKEAHLLVVDYYKWLYHSRVAEEERKSDDFPALTEKQINRLRIFLNK
ncbi:MAG: hypothetical protein WD335_00875 [Candidatus Paceibacterota bacterium]